MFVIKVDMQDNEDGLLGKAIKNIHEKRRAKDVFYAWPPLKLVCERAANILTDELPGSGELTLLEESLVCAFKAYGKVEPGERTQMQAFVKGLLSPIPLIATYKVVLKEGRNKVTWQPFVQPLDKWLKENSPPGTHPTIVREPLAEAPSEMIRAMIAAQIMTLHELQMICESDFSKICTD